ncbi:MAG: hypothetical protein ACRDQ1_15620, partial [Sciscionella sp.]
MSRERQRRGEHARFRSILFTDTGTALEQQEPPYFADLNLVAVVDEITAGRREYDLKPFFYTRLSSVKEVTYRHEVMRDLRNVELYSFIASFANGMAQMREHLAQVDKQHHRYEKQAWLLAAIAAYCDAVTRLDEDLATAQLRSRGFLAFRDYLGDYVRSTVFATLQADTDQAREGLATVRYYLNIKGNRIKVSQYGAEVDYSAEIERTFEKFKQGAVKDYRVEFTELPYLNHVESEVLELVARLYPEQFSTLEQYCQRHLDSLDAVVCTFDREVQFYTAYLDYVERLSAGGLEFCYPSVSNRSKEIGASQTFDIALANKLVPKHRSIVCNDFHLTEPERIIVVGGPNQGGKTTFARMFGQLHHLASIGCLVPGSAAKLYLCD